MKDRINQILAEAQSEIGSALPTQHETLRVKYLGRKSELGELLGKIKDVSGEERAVLGKLGNQVKSDITNLLDELANRIEVGNDLEGFDPTVPGIPATPGRLHPITQLEHELVDFFRSLGFSVAVGPEVESEKNNFDLLNIPADHPARDQWDTFWIRQKAGSPNNQLLRTHTSPVQVRYMTEAAKRGEMPIRVIAPGRVFRYEAEDATHSSAFFQIDGFMVDKGLNVSHLKGILEAMMVRILGDGSKIRFRPSFFPFTEPSFELDVWFNGSWLEAGGCGMIHPKVLTNVGINPETHTGFAFGFGIDRMLMMRYNIKDVRYLLNPNFDFLKQF